jgi:hypothetical protein
VGKIIAVQVLMQSEVALLDSQTEQGNAYSPKKPADTFMLTMEG